MKYFKTHSFFHEVFGEKQSALEVVCTIAFAILGTCLVYSVADFELHDWKVALAFVIIADVLAGVIANFSLGTNQFYAARPKNRIAFIAIHIHIVAIAWFLQAPMDAALITWVYTICSAFLVNALKGKTYQKFIGANLMCYGMLLLIYLQLPMWFLIVSLFFMVKVVFSFSVDHYHKVEKLKP